MSKKLLSVGVVLALVAAVLVGVPAVSAQTASLCSTVDALVAAGVIPAANVAAAKAAAGCSAMTSSAYVFTKDLTVGSTGADVTALQNKLGVTPATGYFGAITKAAVMAYQTSKGISATGYVGPMTRAALNYVAPVVVPPVTGGNTGTTLGGGAGDLTISEKTSGTNNDVLEGEEGAKVLGVEAEADGSDIAIKNVKIMLKAASAGSTRIDRYVDSVDVMLGSKVVGSADVEDFSKDGTEYTKSISLDNAVVKDGDTSRLYVVLNVANNIDTADLDNTLTVTWVNARYMDGDGVTTTDTPTSAIDVVVSFEDLASSGDVTLTTTEVTSVDNDTVSVDATSDTNAVPVLNFALKAKGSDITVMSIPVTIVSSGAGITEIANDFRLLMDGEEVGTVTVGASSTATTTTFTFSNLDDDDVVITDGDTVKFTVEADINDIDGAFSSGDSFTSVTLADDTITAEDEDGNSVGNTALKGSAVTTNLTFLSTGIQVAGFDTTSAVEVENVDTTNTDNQGKYVMTFTVKAFEDPAYITLIAASSTAAASTNGVSFFMEDASADGVALGIGTTTAQLERVSGGTITSSGRLELLEGETATLRLTVLHDSASTSGTFIRVQVNEVAFNDTDAAGDDAMATTPSSDFQSDAVSVKN